MTSTTLSGPRPAEGPRLRPDLLERQPADVRRAGDLPRRHQLRHRPVRRRQVRDERRQEHDRGRQPDARRSATTSSTSRARSTRTTPVKLTGTVDPSRPTADAASTLTGSQPFDWKAQGFLVGQPVHITGSRRSGRSSGSATTTRRDTVDNTRHAPCSSRAGTPATVAAAAVPTSRQPRRSRRDGSASGGGRSRAPSGDWVGGRLRRRPAGHDRGSDGRLGRAQAIANGDLDARCSATARRSSSAASATKTRDVRRPGRCARSSADDVAGGGDRADHDRRRRVRTATRSRARDGGSLGARTASWKASWCMIQGLDGLLAPAPDRDDGRDRRRRSGSSAAPSCRRSPSPSTRMVYWPGPHGGLTVVHGGGNTAAQDQLRDGRRPPSTRHAARRPRVDRRRLRASASASRSAARARRRARSSASSTRPARSHDPFPGCGLEQHDDSSTAAAIPVVDDTKLADPRRRAGLIETTAAMNVTVQATSPLGAADEHAHLRRREPELLRRRGRGGTVFEAGMQVYVSGLAGAVHDRRAVSANAIVLQGAALQPTYAIDPAPTPTTDVTPSRSPCSATTPTSTAARASAATRSSSAT